MPIYLAGNPKFDANLSKLLSKLQDHLTLVTGDDVAQGKNVAFALLYTMQKLPNDPKGVDLITEILESNKLEEVEFIDQKVQEFEKKVKPIIDKILVESLEG